MAGFTLFRGRDSDFESNRRVEKKMQDFVMRYRNLTSCLSPCSHSCIDSYFVTKFDVPHSVDKGIYYRKDGSWLLSVGTLSYNAPNIDNDDGINANILNDFLKNGFSVYERLEGLFVIVCYDAANRTVWILPNEFGFFTVCYREEPNGVGVSTSMLALTSLGPTNLDDFGFYSLYSMGFVQHPYTIIREVPSVS